MTPTNQQIKIRRDGLLMRIFPLNKVLEQVLTKQLRYVKAEYLATELERRKAGNRRMKFTTVRCYKVLKTEQSRQLITNSGFYRRVVSTLKKLNMPYEVKDLKPLGSSAKAFQIDMEAIESTDFRERQKELLQRMLTANRGQICYPTGAGKSFLARILCQALPKARIVFTTKHQAVLKEAYAGLRSVLPSVGIYCSELKQNLGARVMCCSAGSLHHAVEWKPDLVIADETQELATSHCFEKLVKFSHSRFIGLSANYKDRMDGADFELEGLFGPVIATLTYDDAVAAGLIVPINVHLRHVYGHNPIYDPTKRIVRQRYGIWRNNNRNKLIAKDAKMFKDDQVLIVVNTVEHAVYLRQYLPEFELCYSTMPPDKLLKFKQHNLLPEDYRPLTTSDRDQMKRDFESGKLKKVIATSVWNRGVNFHKLQVLIRADAGASRISDTQIPGRLSRLGKNHGTLIDYLDEFDEGFHANAKSRVRQYEKKKWKVIQPENDPLLNSGSKSEHRNPSQLQSGQQSRPKVKLLPKKRSAT